MRFYLGTTEPIWLEDPAFETVPLFLSRNRLVGNVREIRARTRWSLDSGGFSEISKHGEWRTTPKQYAKEAARWQRDIGRMDFAAIQDWMCEPEMIEKTGKSVIEHQILTTRSLLELRDLESELPWLPILQGYEPEDYLRHIDRYDRAGVDLTKEPVVGVGSVCRRQNTRDAEQLMAALHRIEVKVHAFGFSTNGLRNAGRFLHSSDSMAWSYAARFRPVRLTECTHSYKTCEYCPTWALQWRRSLMRLLGAVL